MNMHHRPQRNGFKSQVPQRHPSLPPLKTAAEMTERGKVKFYDKRRGFGFIEYGAGVDVFVHSSIIDQYGVSDRQLEPGVPVRFSVRSGIKGLQADAIGIAT